MILNRKPRYNKIVFVTILTLFFSTLTLSENEFNDSYFKIAVLLMILTYPLYIYYELRIGYIVENRAIIDKFIPLLIYKKVVADEFSFRSGVITFYHQQNIVLIVKGSDYIEHDKLKELLQSNNINELSIDVN